MTCLDLFDCPVEEFISQRRAEAERLVVFLHIPKTAGSSIQRDLGMAFPNGYRVDWENVDQSWFQFVSDRQRESWHHVRGHIHSLHLDMLDEKNIKYLATSFLRHPFSRIVSNYRYCISSASPRQAINRQKYPDLLSFIKDCVNPNHMTRLLVGNCDSVQQAIDKIGRRYSFIGVQECFDFCESILMRSLGADYRPRPRLNVTPRNEAPVMAQVSPSVLQWLVETQSIDIGVFEFFYRRYTALVDSRRRIAS